MQTPMIWMMSKTRPARPYMMALFLVYAAPTEDTFRQCGHLANVLCRLLNCITNKIIISSVHFVSSLAQLLSLTKNVSLQWPQVTLHIPGTVGMGGVTGLGARLMIRLQVVRGHAIRCDEVLQISRQLHGQRTYFLPGGALRMGVASMQRGHLTTCWSRLFVMSIIPWHTRQVTIGTGALWKSDGTWSGPATVPPCSRDSKEDNCKCCFSCRPLRLICL